MERDTERVPERDWEDSERAHILAAQIPPLDKVWLAQHMEYALEVLTYKEIPATIDKPGFRRNLSNMLRIGLRVLERIEISKPPDAFPSWDHYLQSAATLSDIREFHVQTLERSRQVAANQVGRLPVLSVTPGD